MRKPKPKRRSMLEPSKEQQAASRRKFLARLDSKTKKFAEQEFAKLGLCQ